MVNLNEIKTIKYAPWIAWQKQPTEGYIYINNLKNDTFILLEDIGEEIWSLINENKKIDEMIIIISNKYNVSKEVVEDDVNEFIIELLDKGVVVIDD